jgi:tetratricopeptide (TPR) repeat protein
MRRHEQDDVIREDHSTSTRRRTRRAPARPRSRAALLLLGLTAAGACTHLPPPAQQQLAQAEQEYRQNNLAGSAGRLDTILRDYPGYRQSAEAYYLRAKIRISQSNRLGAVADLKKCLSLSMDADLTARAHATAGTMDFEAGDWAGAMRHFEAGIGRLPEKPDTDLFRYRYGICQARMGEWGAARLQFTAVFQRYPQSSVAGRAREWFDWPHDYFVLQCGVYRSESGARKRVAELERAGLQARVEKRIRAGQTLFAACVGSYRRYDQAQEALRSVKTSCSGAVIAPG